MPLMEIDFRGESALTKATMSVIGNKNSHVTDKCKG